MRATAVSFRHRLYPAYKANREPAPAELRRQFALCREFCRHIGVAEFASPEYEADDLIGTLAQHLPRRRDCASRWYPRQGSGAADRAGRCVLGLQRLG